MVQPDRLRSGIVGWMPPWAAATGRLRVVKAQGAEAARQRDYRVLQGGIGLA